MIRKIEIVENELGKEILVDGKNLHGIVRCDIHMEPLNLPKVILEYNPIIANFTVNEADIEFKETDGDNNE